MVYRRFLMLDRDNRICGKAFIPYGKYHVEEGLYTAPLLDYCRWAKGGQRLIYVHSFRGLKVGQTYME